VAETDLGRAALGIDGQLQQITAITGDWAPWGLMTRYGPMVLISMPLVDEAGIGPMNGTIMMGRILTVESACCVTWSPRPIVRRKSGPALSPMWT
jgi:hypothetical protein